MQRCPLRKGRIVPKDKSQQNRGSNDRQKGVCLGGGVGRNISEDRDLNLKIKFIQNIAGKTNSSVYTSVMVKLKDMHSVQQATGNTCDTGIHPF